MEPRKQKYSCFGFILFIFLVSSLYAQETKISIENFGFGKTPQDARFSIYNTGEVILTNFTIYVDGKEYETLEGLKSPGKGFITSLYLEPGKHVVEVKTPEGAYDSLNITISSAKERTFTIIEEPPPFSGIDIIWIVSIIVIIVIVIVVWLLIRKPESET